MNELRAQTFTTGGSADGYALGSVGIEFGILPASFSEWTVSIYSVGSDDFPLNELYTLINPTGAAGDSQEAIFMAPSGTVLEADTNYAVVYVTSATLSPHGAVNNTDATSESVGSAG